MPFDDTTGYLKQQEQTADPFSLESLIAWLEKQNPEERYVWADCARCLYGQYFASFGLRYGRKGEGGVFLANNPNHPFMWALDAGLSFGTATFGAALSRARALLASRKSAS